MKKAADMIEKIQSIFSLILFVVFLLCIVIQVLTRYVPFIKIMWTEEISVYAFIWAIFMGAAVMVRKNGHFAFELIRNRVQGVSKLAVETFIQGTISIFSIYIAYCGVLLTKQFWNWSLTSLPNVSQRFCWSSLIVSGVTMAFYALYNLYETYRAHRGGEEI